MQFQSRYETINRFSRRHGEPLHPAVPLMDDEGWHEQEDRMHGGAPDGGKKKKGRLGLFYGSIRR